MRMRSLLLNVAALGEAEKFFTEGLGLRVLERSKDVVIFDAQPVRFGIREARVDLSLAATYLGWGYDVIFETDDARSLYGRAIAHGAHVVSPPAEVANETTFEIESPLGGFRFVVVQRHA